MFRPASDGFRKHGVLAASLSALFVTLSMIAPAVASPQSFVANLWPQAQARGVPKKVFDAAMSGFQPSAEVMGHTKTQPEFSQTVGAYITKRVSDNQVGKGRSMAGEWSKTLAAVERRYGVDGEAILAIWGMETNFGGFMGGNNTIHALATLTYGGYRADYFRGELLNALTIVAEGHVTPKNMVGSWAGAMGHTQFMPSSFKKYAVDYNGDGHKDIWGSIPDAMASTANYLKEHGWRTGETWGYEVALPRGFDFGRAWTMRGASLGEWAGMGISRISGKPFPRSTDQARLYLPSGGDGPAFLVLPNFDVIKRYNNSDSYALAVGHLADRIIGGGDFAQNWPSAETALNKTQRLEVQSLLNKRGFNVGSPDGVMGSKTRAAIIAFQARAGLLPDGYPSGKLLQKLR